MSQRTIMMCSRNLDTDQKTYWPVDVANQAEAFRHRQIAQNRAGGRFAVSFFLANGNRTPEEQVEGVAARVDQARKAAAKTCTMTAFLAMTKKAQAAFAAEGGTVLPDPSAPVTAKDDDDFGF